MFMSGEGWEFPLGKAVAQDFPIQSKWGVLPDEKKIVFNLFDLERARIQLVYTWVWEHMEEVRTDVHFTEENVILFHVTPGRSHVASRDFLRGPSM